MEDFATLLVQARERSRLTQAEVAQAAGLTASYLCFIERKKRPPPSDDVCRRLAEALGLPPQRLIEVAHMERAPATIRKRVRSLDRTLRRERRSRHRILESLLSPFLFAGPQGFLEGALDAVGIKPARRRRLRKVLAAIGREHHDRADEVSRIVDSLPDQDRDLLLEALPQLLGEMHGRREPPGPHPTEPASPARASAPASASPPPPAAPATADMGAGAHLFYSVPPAGSVPSAPYLLVVDDPRVGEAVLELQAGDRILIDPNAAPGDGDVLVLRDERGDAHLRRLADTDGGFRLEGGGAFAPQGGPSDPLPDRDALAAFLEVRGAGVVVEVRRPLRRRGP